MFTSLFEGETSSRVALCYNNLQARVHDAGASATSAIHHMSQREEEENVQLDKPTNLFDFEFHLGIVAPPFNQRHSKTSALVLCYR